ncbi:DUF2726 domain-containing protein [Deinococcus multiflagellatus]|nr:DUF2726 domain-containing protein [Deinococcus multiflagellatus]MBZ9715928.1 DUF2726 domain-containing protein [Deinococcus multiflagellatus]
MELLGFIIAFVFMGACIGIGVKGGRWLLRMLQSRVAVSAPQTRQDTTFRRTPAPSRPPVDPFQGLDAEIRARVAAQEAAQRMPVPTPEGVPDSLPLRTKQYFFARSEAAFLAVLEQALPAGYRVFPNVRLNDLFFIATRHPGQQKGTYARLRDKHVDFLVVSLPEHRPVFAIELDGASHDTKEQQYRDAVKDVAFRSAGLPLIRLRAETTHTPASLQAVLSRHLSHATLGRAHA